MIRPELSRREFLSKSTIRSVGSAAAFSTAAGWNNRLLRGQTTTATDALPAQVAHSSQGVIATVHPLASQAGIAALERGGNAIDAIVAASLMLSVVDGHNSGLGGGCLALVRQPDGTTVAIDGREMAPQAASPEMFFRDGRPDPSLSQLGPLAAGVPGLVAALERLSQQHGQINWKIALQLAAERAEEGFTVSQGYARVLKSSASRLRQFPSSASVLLDSTGQPWRAGQTIQQRDLARTLRAISEQGSEWFYEGEFAHKAATFLASAGGLMTADDFAKYHTVQRPPIQTQYRGHSVLGFPPPSSGGVHIAQMLGMLSGYDVRSIFESSEAEGLHLLLEVMKRAMADRAYWLGDADFAQVPRGLLDLDYLRQRASSIDLSQVTEVASHGMPPRADLDLFGQQKHTTHLTAADAQGNVVAITQTVNTSFGCKMIVPGTGVVLNNEMDDFSISPGVRNAFGLVGSAANLVAPGKRPLSSMSPTLVLDTNGLPTLSCGAAGGPKIITTVLQLLVRVLDLQQPIAQAIASPRVHHQWSPDTTICEAAMPAAIVAGLEARGHQIERIASAAVAQGITRDETGELTAASDPRVESAALSL